MIDRTAVLQAQRRQMSLLLTFGLSLIGSPAFGQQYCCYDVGGGTGMYLSSSPCYRRGVSVREVPLNNCSSDQTYCFDALSEEAWRPSAGRFDCDERTWSSRINKQQYDNYLKRHRQ